MPGEPYVITSPCLDVTDKACVEVCPVQCIYEIEDGVLVSRYEDGDEATRAEPHPDLQHLHGDRMLYINPLECTACDACMPVCPVDAIFPADQVPDDEFDFIATNRFVFADNAV
jgi:NAD-dependent dihydropyrimidine dehydrogenase PreA subunit